MFIDCEKCSTRFRIDLGRIPPEGARVRCTSCRHVAFVEHPVASDDELADRLAREVHSRLDRPSEATGPARRARRSRASDSLLANLVRLARPHHWSKNVFVLLPVPFALAAGARPDAGVFFTGFAAFCLASSAVYAFNDIRDAEADRHNPKKRHRPLASGAVPLPAAHLLAAALSVAGIGLAWLTGIPAVTVMIGIYLATNAAYSLGAKHVPLLDVFILASGFLLRVLAGCALVLATPSNWLLLCSSSLALFLAFAKRRADLIDGVPVRHRPSLAGYNVGFLDQSLGICAGIAILTYALYSADAEVFVAGREFAGLAFVTFGILDTLRRAYTENSGGSPVEMAFRSPALQLCGLGWMVATAWSLGIF